MPDQQHVDLYLRFVDEAEALTLAGALAGVDALETLPPDGWLGGTYYCIQPSAGPMSVVTEDGQSVAVPEDPTGYHLIGRWHGLEETIPAALLAYRTAPWAHVLG